MRDQVVRTLAPFKPFFHAHGGDFEIRDVTPDGRVKIHFIGECVLCVLKDKTTEGMLEALKASVPGVTRVEAV